MPADRLSRASVKGRLHPSLAYSKGGRGGVWSIYTIAKYGIRIGTLLVFFLTLSLTIILPWVDKQTSEQLEPKMRRVHRSQYLKVIPVESLSSLAAGRPRKDAESVQRKPKELRNIQLNMKELRRGQPKAPNGPDALVNTVDRLGEESEVDGNSDEQPDYSVQLRVDGQRRQPAQAAAQHGKQATSGVAQTMLVKLQAPVKSTLPDRLKSKMGKPGSGYRFARKCVPRPATPYTQSKQEPICFQDLSRVLSYPRFEPNYKSPCWYETVTDRRSQLMRSNLLLKAERKRKTVWGERLADQLRTSWNQRATQKKELKCLPYFYIAGMPKSGSTDLYIRLSFHPQIQLYSLKEPQYFAWKRFVFESANGTLATTHNQSADQRAVPFSHYISRFDHISDMIENGTLENGDHRMITGDGSVSTLYFNAYSQLLDHRANETNTSRTNDPEKTNSVFLSNILPNAKIIILLRDPVSRLYSAYKYFHRARTPPSPEEFHRWTLRSLQLFRRCLQKGRTVRSCAYDKELATKMRIQIHISLYHVYLKDWIKAYTLRHLKVVRFEDYIVNTTRGALDIMQYLELDPIPSRDLTRLSKSNPKNVQTSSIGSMLNETAVLLESFYSEYNVLLAKDLKDDKYLWKDVRNYKYGRSVT